MRRRFGQALRIGVAHDALALVKTSRWQRARPALLAECARENAAHETLAAQLGKLVGESPAAGWPVTVVLSDELVRLWQVTPPAGATRLADLHAAAALRFQTLFGAGAPAWKIAADWNPVRPFLAAALPVTLLAQLEQAAREQRFHLVEIVPQFVAAMNQWRGQRAAGAWFGQLHAGVLTVAAYDEDALCAVRATPVPDGAGSDWLDAFLAREALRLGLPRPQQLQLCGPAPQSWKSACSLLERHDADDWSAAAQLAIAGSLP
jgi:hypothetical protein